MALSGKAASTKGWWRLWVVFTIAWVGLQGAIFVSAAWWQETMDQAEFREFQRRDLYCIDNTVRVVGVKGGPWDRYKLADPLDGDSPAVAADNAGDKPAWASAPLADGGRNAAPRSASWGNGPLVDGSTVDVSCWRIDTIAIGVVSAIGAPLILLLMGIAVIWVWRGFRPPAAWD